MQAKQVFMMIISFLMVILSLSIGAVIGDPCNKAYFHLVYVAAGLFFLAIICLYVLTLNGVII